MKTPVTIVINPFEIPAYIADRSACGGYDKHFKAGISVTVNDLDKEGFVVENMTLIQTIKDSFKECRYKASCEELALGIVNVAAGLVGEPALRISVQVFNLTGHIEANWERGQEVPPFPRLATVEDK